MSLQQIESYPTALLTCSAMDLYKLFPEPTLLHLSGKNKQPLFISILLHGNETTGFLALQRLLVKYANQTLPRSISIFFGNTIAAQHGVRRLDSQPDYNRIWPGSEIPNCVETQFAQEIVTVMKAKKTFASIDIHNNTGLNPHYACINKLENPYLQLANLFGRLVIYFIRPLGVQSAAFSEICPAVTLECGRPGQQFGVDHAFEYLNDCLHLSELAPNAVHSQDINLFHTMAQVKVKDNIDFSFNDQASQLLFNTDLERMNFTEIPADTHFAYVKESNKIPVQAIDEYGTDVTQKFFYIDGQQLRLKRKTMPSMLTLDEQVIRQDCLCYLMERIHCKI